MTFAGYPEGVNGEESEKTMPDIPDRLQEYRASYKKPGMTLAESLGLDIPASAPGGQKLVGSPWSSDVRASERARRHQEIRDEGFYDHDAFGRADA